MSVWNWNNNNNIVAISWDIYAMLEKCTRTPTVQTFIKLLLYCRFVKCYLKHWPLALANTEYLSYIYVYLIHVFSPIACNSVQNNRNLGLVDVQLYEHLLNIFGYECANMQSTLNFGRLALTMTLCLPSQDTEHTSGSQIWVVTLNSCTSFQPLGNVFS